MLFPATFYSLQRSSLPAAPLHSLISLLPSLAPCFAPSLQAAIWLTGARVRAHRAHSVRHIRTQQKCRVYFEIMVSGQAGLTPTACGSWPQIAMRMISYKQQQRQQAQHHHHPHHHHHGHRHGGRPRTQSMWTFYVDEVWSNT